MELEALTHSRRILRSDFLQRWQDKLPESWRDQAKLDALQVNYLGPHLRRLTDYLLAPDDGLRGRKRYIQIRVNRDVHSRHDNDFSDC